MLKNYSDISIADCLQLGISALQNAHEYGIRGKVSEHNECRKKRKQQRDFVYSNKNCGVLLDYWLSAMIKKYVARILFI